MACYHCSQMCSAYATLKGNLSGLSSQISPCLSMVDDISTTFTSVIIGGKPVGVDEISGVKGKLGSIVEVIGQLMDLCDTRISEILSACPGEKHYKN